MEGKQTKYWHSRKLDKGSQPFPHEAIGVLQQKTLLKRPTDKRQFGWVFSFVLPTQRTVGELMRFWYGEQWKGLKWDSDCIQRSHSALCGQKGEACSALQRYTQHLRFIRLASFFLMEQVLYRIYDSFSPYNASLVAMVTRNCVMTMVNLKLTKPSLWWLIGQPSSSDCSDSPSLVLYF